MWADGCVSVDVKKLWKPGGVCVSVSVRMYMCGRIERDHFRSRELGRCVRISTLKIVKLMLLCVENDGNYQHDLNLIEITLRIKHRQPEERQHTQPSCHSIGH